MSSPDDDGLDALAAAAQRGDGRALDRLLALVRPQVHRYVLARLIDRHLAEDVTQEVGVAIVASLPRYVRTDRPVIAWVFGIAAHKVSEAHRRHGRRPETVVDDLPDLCSLAESADPALTAETLESSRAVAALLASLRHPQGEILRLRIVAGLSTEETAAVLGLTPGAVRVAQHRALNVLRARVLSQPDGKPPRQPTVTRCARRGATTDRMGAHR
ncbi:MAG: sigma-70 family RNA polymerase sigma factor [Jatrophihabitans sp.]|uniref:sigma-70 family RNA polymerase sigma factor n=1 Tax=Jatrophihabitans sp. TaxID=1932789 RepID=UPI003F817CA4